MTASIGILVRPLTSLALLCASMGLGLATKAHAIPPSDELPSEMAAGTQSEDTPQASPTEATVSTDSYVAEPEAEAETQAPRPTFRVYPAARVALGAGWLSGDSHLVFDVALGVHIFQRPAGIDTGVLVGVTRRSADFEWTALTVGVPLGYVSRGTRISLGVRPDLLAGRGAGEALLGGRVSAYLAYRQSVFVEGGYERLRVDGAAVDGYRVVVGIDLGVVIASLFAFGGAMF